MKTNFNSDKEELDYLENWLENRPSASMDCAIEQWPRVIYRIKELKRTRRQTVREPSKMLESQNSSYNNN